MRVVGLEIMNKFINQHGDVRDQMRAWVCEALEATWKNPAEIKARYASASFLSDNRVVFNIKGNKYRLEVKVNYKSQIVLLKRVGTHSEYSKW